VTSDTTAGAIMKHGWRTYSWIMTGATCPKWQRIACAKPLTITLAGARNADNFEAIFADKATLDATKKIVGENMERGL
jgi:hypothetical protein